MPSTRNRTKYVPARTLVTGIVGELVVVCGGTNESAKNSWLPRISETCCLASKTGEQVGLSVKGGHPAIDAGSPDNIFGATASGKLFELTGTESPGGWT